MPVLPVDPSTPAPAAIDRAARLLRAGGLVAFPTETVYGLGADAHDDTAVRRIFTAKGRPADNPLIVHLAAAEGLEQVAAEISPLAWALAARWWPGPLTLVMAAHPSLPAPTTGGLSTVAVRVPDHPVALALLTAAGVPVAAPSANRSGRPSPTRAAHVQADLGDRVDLILDGGPCRVGVESTVIDVRGPQPVVLREGSVTREQLGAAAGGGDIAASPGTRHRHYQPSCRVVLAPPGGGASAALRARADGSRVGLVAPGGTPTEVEPVLRYADAEGLAAHLYQALRTAEEVGVDVLVVEGVAEEGIGRAVMDRLRRAAAG